MKSIFQNMKSLYEEIGKSNYDYVIFADNETSIIFNAMLERKLFKINSKTRFIDRERIVLENDIFKGTKKICILQNFVLNNRDIKEILELLYSDGMLNPKNIKLKAVVKNGNNQKITKVNASITEDMAGCKDDLDNIGEMLLNEYNEPFLRSVPLFMGENIENFNYFNLIINNNEVSFAYKHKSAYRTIINELSSKQVILKVEFKDKIYYIPYVVLRPIKYNKQKEYFDKIGDYFLDFGLLELGNLFKLNFKDDIKNRELAKYKFDTLTYVLSFLYMQDVYGHKNISLKSVPDNLVNEFKKLENIDFKSYYASGKISQKVFKDINKDNNFSEYDLDDILQQEYFKREKLSLYDSIDLNLLLMDRDFCFVSQILAYNVLGYSLVSAKVDENKDCLRNDLYPTNYAYRIYINKYMDVLNSMLLVIKNNLSDENDKVLENYYKYICEHANSLSLSQYLNQLKMMIDLVKDSIDDYNWSSILKDEKCDENILCLTNRYNNEHKDTNK